MLSNFIALPFCLLILLISLGPVIFKDKWNKYLIISVTTLSLIVVTYYTYHLKDHVSMILAGIEYVQFVSLIAALYVISSGIHIDINIKPTPGANTLFLFLGSVIANIIGTTGASILLIRPYLKMNKNHLKCYHVIFFIFVVSNVGGGLTPIGDPPLFIGFLKGIPFLWTVIHNFIPWSVALVLLLGIFYYKDAHNNRVEEVVYSSKRAVIISGSKNFIWISLVICAVFINPIIFPNLPTIEFHGHSFSYLRECVLMLITVIAYLSRDKAVYKKNNFSWEPMSEIAVLFIGIFITMTPMLEIIQKYVKCIDHNLITTSSLFWTTGFLSSVLDNCPTYVNFLTLSMAINDLDVGVCNDVVNFANGMYPNSIANLRAISVASVFFGAMTYIGNGPNFMIKAISEKYGIRLPSFFEYILYYSIPFLLPILGIIWYICLCQ